MELPHLNSFSFFPRQTQFWPNLKNFLWKSNHRILYQDQSQRLELLMIPSKVPVFKVHMKMNPYKKDFNIYRQFPFTYFEDLLFISLISPQQISVKKPHLRQSQYFLACFLVQDLRYFPHLFRICRFQNQQHLCIQLHFL